MSLEKEIYIVDKIIKEAKDIVTICFVPESGTKMIFHAGQFVRVDFIDSLTFANAPSRQLSNKPYSISSTPADLFLSISVKKTGLFSNALHELTVGDKVGISGPFGSLPIGDSMKKLVFIAGGIGIAPFYSIIKDLYERGDINREVKLLYSNKTKEDIAFYNQLKKIGESWDSLNIINILTKEDSEVSGIDEYTRFDKQIFKKYVSDTEEQNYFICGSVSFVTEVSKIIETENINESQIFAELFY
jgi:ferredoxin-NADP reductase